MVDCLHAPMQAERGQRLFLALPESDGRTTECNFIVGTWLGCRVGTGKALLEDGSEGHV